MHPMGWFETPLSRTKFASISVRDKVRAKGKGISAQIRRKCKRGSPLHSPRACARGYAISPPAGMRVNLRVFSHQWNHPLRLRHGGKGELQNGDCRNRRQSFRLASIPTMLSTWRSWRHPIPALDFSNSRSFDGFALPAQRRHKAVKSRSRLLRASVVSDYA